ncbi:MAG: fibronectin type III domain-containing protein [Bacteroidetes bacterium]|nr:fibronectin type III domain-containing protein [Bacteroidota bacterium]
MSFCTLRPLALSVCFLFVLGILEQVHAQAFTVTYDFPVNGSGSSCSGGTAAVNEPSGSSSTLPALCVSTGLVQRVNGLSCVGAPVYAGFNSSCWQNATKPASQSAINSSPAVSWVLNACFGDMEIDRVNLSLRRSNTGPQSAAVFYRVDAGSWQQWGTDMSGYTTDNANSTAYSQFGSVSVPKGSQVEFRLVAWNGTGVTNCSTNGGTLRLRTQLNISGTMSNATLPAPASLTPDNIGCSSFTARWQLMPDASAYLLEVSDRADFATLLPGYEGTAELSASTVTREVTGLNQNTTYYYRVRARRKCDQYGGASIVCNLSDYSAVQSAQTLTTGTAPTVDLATNVGCAGFTANWQAYAGATGFRVEWSPDITFTTGVSHQDIADGTATSYTVTGLDQNTTYYYRVRAADACGNTPFSVGAQVTTLDRVATPAIQPAGSIGCSGFTAHWDAAAGATGYTLEWADNAGFSSATTVNIPNGAATSHTITGLSLNTTYHYRIRATDACGTTSFSGSVQATTLSAPVASVVQPAGSIGCSDFTAHWDAVPGATGYTLEWADNAGFSGAITVNIPDGTTVSEVLTGLNPGTDYYYRVRATDPCGTTAFSSAIQATTLILQAPDLTVGPLTCNSISLSWNAIAGAANGYTLEYTRNGNTQTVDVMGTSTVLTGLLANTSYSCRIRTRGVSGCADSPYSPSQNAHTLISPDLGLAVSAADICYGQTTAVQVAGSQVGVQYSLRSASGAVLQGPVPGNGSMLSFTLPGLTAGDYGYRVFASNGAASEPCEDYLHSDAAFRVHGIPAIGAEHVQTVPVNTALPFSVEDYPVVTFLTPADGNTYTFQYPDGSAEDILPGGVPALHAFAANGYYTVQVTVDNGYCDNTHTLMVDTRYESVVRFPNVFTPNNDGINDHFEVTEGPSDIIFQVFSRWGTLVYSTSRLPVRWNGRIENTGTECPEGSYVYTYKVSAPPQVAGFSARERSGTITLIR